MIYITAYLLNFNLGDHVDYLENYNFVCVSVGSEKNESGPG